MDGQGFYIPKKERKKAVENDNSKRLHRAFKMEFTRMGFYKKLVGLTALEGPTVIV